MDKIEKLYELGQSLWYDNIERNLLENGQLNALIKARDIRGITSNPTIFNKAIGKTHDYDAALKRLAKEGLNAEQIFYELAVEDIRNAADLFTPVFQETQGGDGFVSIEVSPLLAHDTTGTVAEVKRLWEWVNRPNLMVKIPATKEGIEAIRQSLAAGININITLIFSLNRYAEVMEAHMRGLEERISKGLPVNQIASVASFFVSRLDTKIDPRLEAVVKADGERGEKAKQLFGKAAIANTRLAYQEFLKVTQSERFKRMQEKGVRVQRPLWASTSTKNPAYSDVMYVDELVAPDTVNTVPQKTLEAFKDHGKVAVTIENELDEARSLFQKLADVGIDINVQTQELEDEGVESFADSFHELLETVEERRVNALAEEKTGASTD